MLTPEFLLQFIAGQDLLIIALLAGLAFKAFKTDKGELIVGKIEQADQFVTSGAERVEYAWEALKIAYGEVKELALQQKTAGADGVSLADAAEMKTDFAKMLEIKNDISGIVTGGSDDQPVA